MIEGTVTGSAEVVQRFSDLPLSIRRQLKASVSRLTIKLERKVKSKLDGEVLQRRTGRLTNSITSAVVESGNDVTGLVSTGVEYARAHEYGLDKVVSVRAHVRNIKQAFGRSINPVAVEVAAHSMHMKFPERSFLRSSLRQLQESGVISSDISDAMKEAVK